MLFPGEYYESTYDIPFKDYYSKGFRGVIFDIDNTLVEHNAPADERSRNLFDTLRSIGFRTVLISNNSSDRTAPFADAVKTPFVSKAWKPKKNGYIRACRLMELPASECLFVGDQIYTDILGANNAGIHSILVKQIGPDPELQIVLKRIIEKPVIALYKIVRK